MAKRRIDAKPLSLLAKVLLSDMITFAKQTHGEQLHYERGLHNSVNKKKTRSYCWNFKLGLNPNEKEFYYFVTKGN